MKKEKEENPDGNEEEGQIEEENTSFNFNGVSGQAPVKTKVMNPGMKKDRDTYRKKLKVLERKLKDEEIQNNKIFNMRRGEYVQYGNIIQLLHVDSNCFVQATKQCADEDNSCNKIELALHGAKSVYFKALGGFKYKKEGDSIHYNDQIVLYNLKTSMFLHVTERFLKIDGLEGPLPENLMPGKELITPKVIDRREPPNQYVPYFEVNVSNIKSKFNIQIFRYFNEDPDE